MKFVDVIGKIVTPLLAVLSLIWGIYQYRVSKENDYRNTLYKQQYDIYSELLNVTASIAITDADSTGTQKFKDAVQQFDHLYFGRMHLIQNDSVIGKMQKFYTAVKNYEDVNHTVNRDSIHNLSIELANTCKKSLQATKEIYLKDQKPIE
jgi:hypothetical protein